MGVYGQVAARKPNIATKHRLHWCKAHVLWSEESCFCLADAGTTILGLTTLC